MFPLSKDDWLLLKPQLGDPSGQGGLQADSGLVELVLPQNVVISPSQVRGTCYPTSAFENIFWAGGQAVRVEGGLIVSMFSR